MVRAKFCVVSKFEATSASGNGFTVILNPVVDGSLENKEFYKWTPAGKIELTTINKKAADALEVGKSYYVDFSLAE